MRGGVDHVARECKKEKTHACFHCGWLKCPAKQSNTVCHEHPYCLRCEKSGHSTFQIYDCPLGVNAGVRSAIRREQRLRNEGLIVKDVNRNIIPQTASELQRSGTQPQPQGTQGGFRRPQNTSSSSAPQPKTSPAVGADYSAPQALRISDFLPPPPLPHEQGLSKGIGKKGTAVKGTNPPPIKGKGKTGKKGKKGGSGTPGQNADYQETPFPAPRQIFDFASSGAPQNFPQGGEQFGPPRPPKREPPRKVNKMTARPKRVSTDTQHPGYFLKLHDEQKMTDEQPNPRPTLLPSKTALDALARRQTPMPPGGGKGHQAGYHHHPYPPKQSGYSQYGTNRSQYY